VELTSYEQTTAIDTQQQAMEVKVVSQSLYSGKTPHDDTYAQRLGRCDKLLNLLRNSEYAAVLCHVRQGDEGSDGRVGGVSAVLCKCSVVLSECCLTLLG
jgi:hypothetical protein